MATYEARVELKDKSGSLMGTQKVTVQAESASNARMMLEAAYGSGNVHFVSRCPDPGRPVGSTSSKGSGLGALVFLGVLALIAGRCAFTPQTTSPPANDTTAVRAGTFQPGDWRDRDDQCRRSFLARYPVSDWGSDSVHREWLRRDGLIALINRGWVKNAAGIRFAFDVVCTFDPGSNGITWTNINEVPGG